MFLLSAYIFLVGIFSAYAQKERVFRIKEYGLKKYMSPESKLDTSIKFTHRRYDKLDRVTLSLENQGPSITISMYEYDSYGNRSSRTKLKIRQAKNNENIFIVPESLNYDKDSIKEYINKTIEILENK